MNIEEVFSNMCEQCEHEAVCKYKTSAKPVVSAIQETVQKNDNADCLSVKVDCKYLKYKEYNPYHHIEDKGCVVNDKNRILYN